VKAVRLLVIVVVGIMGVYSCAYHDIAPHHEETAIRLRWVKGYPSETKEDVIKGLSWSLSFLGAMIPEGSMEKAVEWENEKRFVLHLNRIGFNSRALDAFKQLLPAIKNSDEYKVHGGIDLGRFTLLTLNSTYHYYAITGAKARLDDFKASYTFHEQKAAVLISSIAKGHRLIEVSEADRFGQIAFMATEGTGSIADGNFAAREFEAMDFMPNGQPRFALYDIDGNLKSVADSSLTAAGKPVKCLWCHEIRLLPPFDDDHTLDGYYSSAEFKSMLDERMKLVEKHRETLNTDINFRNLSDHTKTELLYISFMEPSAGRLAEEWGIPLEQVQQKVQGLPTHAHHEFSFLGDELYLRKDVDHLAPYSNLQVPDNARDRSAYEPDLIHF
jgi:hypothetical protein